MEMQKRALGRTGWQVSPWMLGGNVFGWTADEPTSFQLLDAYVDFGGNFIDTADVYTRWIEGHQGGESEEVLGRWFQQSGKRDQVILATKVGMDMGKGKGLGRTWIKQAVEDSLRRLGTDRIDLYQTHKDDPDTPLEETLEALAQLVKEGKVRAIGASNYSAARLTEALEISERNNLPRFETLQPHYNLLEREDFEQNLLPVVQKYELGVVPYFALAAGFLTGKYRSKADVEGKARAGTVGKYANERGFAVIRTLEEVAQTYRANPTHIALAWLMARPGITAPIASATNLTQLCDLARACFLPLQPGDVEKLDAVSEQPVTA